MKKALLLAFATQCFLTLFALDVINLTDEAHLAGPKLTEKQLKRKVLLVEVFGHTCGPCVVSMPHIVDIAEDFKKDGRLVVIASHAWDRNMDKINAFIERTGSEAIPFYQGFKVDGAPGARGVPFAYIVDHKGEVIWSGHPGDGSKVREVITEAVKAAPAAGQAGGFFADLTVTHNKDLMRQIVIGKNGERALKVLRGRAQKPTPQGEEAQAMVDAIETWVDEQKALVDEIAEATPSKALLTLRTLRSTFPSAGAELKETFMRLSKDKATVELAKMRSRIDALKANSKMSPKQRAASIKSMRMLLSRQAQDNADVADILSELDTLN